MDEPQQRFTGSRGIDVQKFSPLLMIAALALFVVIFTKWGIVAAVSFWLVFMVVLLLWGLGQRTRARREIRSEIERAGCMVIKMNFRFFRIGPFSLLNSSRSQRVYRVVVREPTGRERIVWAQWGRRWFFAPDVLELKWEQ